MKPHESITTERATDALRESMFGTEDVGFCYACGAEQGGCEPDAERYPCEVCGERQVHGAETTLLAVGF